jgi:hypothetical protein
MDLEKLSHQLDEKRKSLSACSCTLYVRDAYWDGQYRLVCMPGVAIREPMYGLVAPDPSRRAICEGDAEVFQSNPERVPGPKNPIARVPSGIKRRDRLLFAEFREREGVKSYARLFHLGSDGRPEAVFFVNFAKRVKFDVNLRRLLAGRCSSAGKPARANPRRPKHGPALLWAGFPARPWQPASCVESSRIV